jgi:hypothetical protein
MPAELVHILFALAGGVITYIATKAATTTTGTTSPVSPAPTTPATPSSTTTLSIPLELLAAVQALIGLHQQANTAQAHAQLSNLVNSAAQAAAAPTTPEASRSTRPT